jgi:hypothetical protein
MPVRRRWPRLSWICSSRATLQRQLRERPPAVVRRDVDAVGDEVVVLEVLLLLDESAVGARDRLRREYD